MLILDPQTPAPKRFTKPRPPAARFGSRPSRPPPPRPAPRRFPMRPTFTAIDFETANRYRNSACAVGLVRVEFGRIVERAYHLIRPPFRWFEFTDVHGIDWRMVRGAPTFRDLWPELRPMFEGVEFVAAHNAPFDRGVLGSLCDWYGLASPEVAFECTVAVARRTWGLYPTRLPDVASFLGLELNHHNAASDAEACARIVMRSRLA